MYGLKVRIRCIIDESYPKWVECVMTDYEGQTHYFRDKLPVFSMDSEPSVPCDGIIRCTVIRETPVFAEIDTALPDSVESTMGISRFCVSLADLTDDA